MLISCDVARRCEGVLVSLVRPAVTRCCGTASSPAMLGCWLYSSVSQTPDGRRVAQNLLDMSEVGVLLVGEMHPSKPGRAKDRLALIGRVCARIESVDFNALFKR